MPKATPHPTHTKLLEKSRAHRMKVAHKHGIALRQNYARTASSLALTHRPDDGHRLAETWEQVGILISGQKLGSPGP